MCGGGRVRVFNNGFVNTTKLIQHKRAQYKRSVVPTWSFFTLFYPQVHWGQTVKDNAERLIYCMYIFSLRVIFACSTTSFWQGTYYWKISASQERPLKWMENRWKGTWNMSSVVLCVRKIHLTTNRGECTKSRICGRHKFCCCQRNPSCFFEGMSYGVYGFITAFTTCPVSKPGPRWFQPMLHDFLPSQPVPGGFPSDCFLPPSERLKIVFLLWPSHKTRTVLVFTNFQFGSLYYWQHTNKKYKK